MPVAGLGHMTMDLKVLKNGNCEELKLGIHATTLGLATLCGLYNAAAWLSRREQHLALNTVMYAVLIAIEQRHVVHHIAELRQCRSTAVVPSVTNVVAITGAAGEIAA